MISSNWGDDEDSTIGWEMARANRIMSSSLGSTRVYSMPGARLRVQRVAPAVAVPSMATSLRPVAQQPATQPRPTVVAPVEAPKAQTDTVVRIEPEFVTLTKSRF